MRSSSTSSMTETSYNWLVNTNNVVSLPSSLVSLTLTWVIVIKFVLIHCRNCSISQPLMSLLNNTVSCLMAYESKTSLNRIGSPSIILCNAQ